MDVNALQTIEILEACLSKLLSLFNLLSRCSMVFIWFEDYQLSVEQCCVARALKIETIMLKSSDLAKSHKKSEHIITPKKICENNGKSPLTREKLPLSFPGIDCRSFGHFRRGDWVRSALVNVEIRMPNTKKMSDEQPRYPFGYAALCLKGWAIGAIAH